MDKLKVLVLGDGLLGSELVKQTGWDFVSRKTGTFDMTNFWASFPKNDYYEPKHDVIINCIANTNTYSTDKQLHWKVNYEFVNNLIEYCNTYRIKLVHISTDYLYASSVNNASENDVPVHCNNWYGYTKLLADGLIQLRSNDFLLIRCTHKPKPFPYEKAWDNQIGNFDYVDIIASKIIDLVNIEAEGLFNVGTETKTMFELALLTNNVEAISAPEHIPHNTSMDITKMNNILK